LIVFGLRSSIYNINLLNQEVKTKSMAIHQRLK